MLSSDSDNPMTCGFVYENRRFHMNRGYFWRLRQKIGNNRVLTIVKECPKTPKTKKEPRAPGIKIQWHAGLVDFGG